MKKNSLYLTAIIVLTAASLLILPVGCSTNVDETASNGIETTDVPDTSHKDVDTATSDEKEELIFLSKRGYISEAGCPTIVGEVTNAGNSSMEDILITATFYCTSGRIIGAKEDMSAISSGYTEIETLAPGETSPFKVAVSLEELAMLPKFDVNKVEKYKVVVK